MLENKLDWAPGSMENIRAGGEHKEKVVELRRNDTTPLSYTWKDALYRDSTEELLLELRRSVIEKRDRRQETWDDWDGGIDKGGQWIEQG